MCLVELQKLRHDRTELITRAVQPALWLVVFGNVFTQLHAIPTGDVPYLDFLAPGISPSPRCSSRSSTASRSSGSATRACWPSCWSPHAAVALVAAKAFAAGIRAIAQASSCCCSPLLLGVGLSANPLHWLGVVVAMLLGAAFFCCLSIAIAGLVLSRDRLMGIGQAITMPLFFASNALYPVALMPGWLQVVNHVNPLSYEVDALRGLLIGTRPTCGWTSRCCSGRPH
jgi:ABC-2 type transport system permease protein